MISKNLVWKGLKLELSAEELRNIYDGEDDEFETDDYYNYNLYMDVLHKATNNSIDFDYFMDWCILVANCLNFTQDNNNKKLKKLYGMVGCFFDGISFMEDFYDKNEYKKQLLCCIAQFKHFNYLIQVAKKQISEPWTTNGVERILNMDHVNLNYNSDVYRVIIKNYNTKQWQIKYMDDYCFSFKENINYTFVDDKEFDKIFQKFFKDETWKEVNNLEF